MDFERACHVLDIAPDSYMTVKNIKKSYYKKSLIYHPDRINNMLGTESSTLCGEKFKEINAAYEYLTEHIIKTAKSENVRREAREEKETSKGNALRNMDYFQVFMKFLKLVRPSLMSKWNNVFIESTVKNFFGECNHLIEEIFEDLEKEKALELYQIILENKEIIPISHEVIRNIKKIIQKRMEHDNVIIINPSLEDLLYDKIYQLSFMDRILHIPLWHDKLFFEIDSKDLIVKIIPDLGENFFLDRFNNLHIRRQRNIREILEKGEISLDIHGKKFSVPSQHLKIVSEQIILVSNEGILKNDRENIYENNKRGKIYLNLYLT